MLLGVKFKHTCPFAWQTCMSCVSPSGWLSRVQESLVHNTPGPHGKKLNFHIGCESAEPRARVRLYLVRKLEPWRINRAELFLMEGGVRRNGKQHSDEEGWNMRREAMPDEKREDVRERTSVEKLNNKSVCGEKSSCFPQSLRKWKHSKEGSWSKDDEECGTLAAIWLWVCGMLCMCMTEAEWFPSPGPLE